MEHSRNGFLKKKSIKELCRNATSYLIDTYTMYPKSDEIIEVCSAIIDIFPSLNHQNSNIGGIVSPFNIFLYQPVIPFVKF